MTTQKAKEVEKIRELLLAVKAEPTPSSKDMEFLSNQAIGFVLHQASIEPENLRALNGPVPARHKKGKTHMPKVEVYLGFFEWLGNIFARGFENQGWSLAECYLACLFDVMYRVKRWKATMRLEYLEFLMRINNKMWWWKNLKGFVMLGKNESLLYNNELYYTIIVL